MSSTDRNTHWPGTFNSHGQVISRGHGSPAVVTIEGEQVYAVHCGNVQLCGEDQYRYGVRRMVVGAKGSGRGGNVKKGSAVRKSSETRAKTGLTTEEYQAKIGAPSGLGKITRKKLADEKGKEKATEETVLVDEAEDGGSAFPVPLVSSRKRLADDGGRLSPVMVFRSKKAKRILPDDEDVLVDDLILPGITAAAEGKLSTQKPDIAAPVRNRYFPKVKKESSAADFLRGPNHTPAEVDSPASMTKLVEAQSTIKAMQKKIDDMAQEGADKDNRLIKAERLVMSTGELLAATTRTLCTMSEMLHHAEDKFDVEAVFRSDHSDMAMDLVAQLNAFEKKYNLDFIPVPRQSKTRPWCKGTVADDLKFFCEKDTERFTSIPDVGTASEEE